MKQKLLLSALLMLFVSQLRAQLPVAYWSFEDATHSTINYSATDQVSTASASAVTGTITLASNNGAGTALHSGISAGQGLYSSGTMSTTSTDPTTSATTYWQFNFSTLGFSGLTLNFDAYINSATNSPFYGFLYSTNGTTWNYLNSLPSASFPFTAGSWGSGSQALPAACNNQATVYIRIYGYYRLSSGKLEFDNIMVTASSTTAGAVFTTANETDIYNMVNSGATGITSRNSFAASGAGTNVTINSSGLAMGSSQTFGLTSSATATFGSSGSISGTGGIFNIASGCSLVTSNTGGVPSSVTTTGTNVYAAGANYTFNAATTTPFPTGTFNNPANVTINPGAGTSVSLNINPTITGVLSFGSGKLALNGKTLTLNGTVTGMSAANVMIGSASSNLAIGGTGALGTLYFDQGTDGTTNNIATCTLNRTSSGTVTLGNKLVSGTALTLTSGQLQLNGQTLNLNGTFTGSSANNLQGNTSSVVNIGGSGTLGTLYFDQTTSGTTNALSGLTMNRTGVTATLGNNLFIGSGALNLTAGTVDDGGNVISLSGNITGAGIHTGTGKISMTGTGSTISAATLGNLELNGSNFSLAASPTVAGTLTFTSGKLTLGANNLVMGLSSSFGGTPSASSMLVATGAGTVKRLMNANGNYLFPVGDAANYTPISLNFTSGAYGGSAYSAVNLAAVKHPSNANATNYLSRYWHVVASGISSPMYNVSATYVPGDVVGTELAISSAQYTGTLPWVRFGGVNTGTHTLSSTTVITTVSDFTGINSANPTVNSSASGTVCLGGSLPLSASSGTGDAVLSYSWAPATDLSSTAGASVTATPSATRTYTLTITDGNGFTGNATTTVTVNPVPTAAPTNDGPICPGGTVNLVAHPANGASSYTWNGPALTFTNVADPSASPISAVVYSLTVSDGTGNPGCSPATVYTTSVSVDPLPFANALSNSPVCENTDIELTADAAANVTDYIWSGPAAITDATTDFATIPSAPLAAAGTYTLTLYNGTGSGCVATYTTTVTMNSKPATTSVTGGGIYCGSAVLTAGNGGDGTMYFQGDVSGGIYYGYPTNTYTVTASDVYYFRAQSAAGCWGDEGSATVIINPAPAVAVVSGGGTYCGSATITAFNGNDGTMYFQGTTSGGTSTATAATSQSVSASGTYYFRARSAGGCWGPEGSVTVNINALPATPAVSGAGTFCASTTISASNGGDGTIYYQDIVAGGTSTATPATSAAITSSGTYYFRAQSAAGCWSSDGSANVTINPLPAAVTASGGGTYCGSTTITASNGGDGTIYFQGTIPNGTSMADAASSETVTSSGTYYFRALSASGCWGPQGSVTVTINHIPTDVTVSGTGTFCGSTTITADNGGDGTIYFQGITPLGTSTATASSSEAITSSGTYYFRAQSPAGCWSNEGNAAVVINPLPAGATVSGAGTYCDNATLLAANGGDGTIYFQGTISGGTATTAPAVSEVVASSGTYYFRAQSAAGCWGNQGSAAVVINTSPAAVTVAGGGTYCDNATILASNGNDGTIYFQGTTSGGTATAAPSVSQSITSSGTYYFRAQSAAGCWGQEGSTAVTINALPATTTVSGGGTYCGSTIVTANNGNDGTMYFQGATSGGTSTAQPASFATILVSGTYYFRAQSAAGCWGPEGSVTVTINDLPAVYNLSATASSACAGFAAAVNLSSTSLASGTYTIHYDVSGADNTTGNITTVAISAGSGSFDIPAAYIATPGANTITITSFTNSNTCVSPTTTGNTANFDVYALPAAVATSGAGAHCDHTTITADNGSDGTMYFQGTTPGGTATDVPASSALITTSGTYYFRALSSHGCWGPEGSVAVTINALPAVQTVSAGGHYCAGSAGVSIDMPTTENGIYYQLYHGPTAVGSLLIGNGAPMSFGSYTVEGTYTVSALNPVISCTNDMAGSAQVVMDTLPAIHIVSGDGSYCAGGGGVHVLLNMSDPGIHYQLYNGTSYTGIELAGSGASLDFGAQLAAGTYTATATDGITGCMSNMSGSATVVVNPLPIVFAVTGSGSYCVGGAGLPVGLTGSQTGADYRLYDGAATVSGIVAGATGTGTLSLGVYTASGTYSVMATDHTTGCTNPMSGSATIAINPLPVVHNVTGSGSYCAGGAGLPVGLDNSEAGIKYTLYTGATAVSGAIAGTTSAPVTFGSYTAAATYTAVATNPGTGCSSNMSGSATITITPLVYPAITISASATTLCSGNTVSLSAASVNGGATPAYEWSVNGAPAATGDSYAYVPANGDVIIAKLTSNAVCATPDTAVDTVSMTVIPSNMPVVAISADPGENVCQGTIVHYTAASTYGGSAPVYMWMVNGSHVFTGPAYTYVPANTDMVYCKMASDLVCRLADTVSSIPISMIVNFAYVPVVTLNVHPGFATGSTQADTIKALVINGGSSPTYQWNVNGVDVPGATNETYTGTFNENDVVTCYVTSSGVCPYTSLNSVTITISKVGVAGTATETNVNIAPNPNKGMFSVTGTVNAADGENPQIEITDMAGHVVYSQSVSAASGHINEQIVLDNVSNGIYLLSVRSASAHQVFHVVVAK